MNSRSIAVFCQTNSPVYSPSTPDRGVGATSDNARPDTAESSRRYEYRPYSPCLEVGAHSDSAVCGAESIRHYRPSSPVVNQPVANQPPVRQFDAAVLKTELGKRAIARIREFDGAVQYWGKRVRTYRNEDVSDGGDDDEEDEKEPQTHGGLYAPVSMQSRIREAWGTLHWLEKLASIARADLEAVDPAHVLDLDP
jgi:hypothetical protein